MALEHEASDRESTTKVLKDDRASVLKGRSEFEKSPSHKLVHVYLQPLGQRAIFIIS